MKHNKQMKHALSKALITIATTLALAGTVNAANRSTSYTYYDTAPKQGLLTTIDGARTDVTDITTLDYDNYGNLTSVVNARIKGTEGLIFNQLISHRSNSSHPVRQ